MICYGFQRVRVYKFALPKVLVYLPLSYAVVIFIQTPSTHIQRSLAASTASSHEDHNTAHPLPSLQQCTSSLYHPSMDKRNSSVHLRRLNRLRPPLQAQQLLSKHHHLQPSSARGRNS